MNLFLIRHGESVGNKLGKIQGCLDFELSDLGKRQAELVGEFFKTTQLDYIYSSDLERAYQTAYAIAKNKEANVHKWDKVREVYLGPFQGLSREEIFLQYPEAKERSILTSGVMGTETTNTLTERCRYVVNQLQRAHSKHNVAIVSHGGFISIFLMYLMLGDAWKDKHRPFQIDNTSITHIEWKGIGNSPLFHYVNRNNHLIFDKEDQKKGYCS
ncbi:histidine phosphatase family protein [Bacillus solitudinis]|uniref:histidine phosphatase family protein n=1 Tax=Bacillus solitudinis TaxID=2014074 RepID=UPI000C2434B7|nr:histidine phosphatase family protein [Bacillus solitudinis]